MFKHILVPTDGSPLSEAAVAHAVEFAKSIGAKITGLHVIPPFHTFTYDSEMLEDTREQFDKDSQAHAEHFLAKIESMAKEAGCDVIAMASHGRKGMKGLLMGSETQKVLTHSTIPVLIYH